MRLKAVRSAATSGKLYRLPVDKENTACTKVNSTLGRDQDKINLADLN